MERFAELKLSLELLIKEICRRFSEWDIPSRPWVRIVPVDETTTNFQTERRPDFSLLVPEIYSNLETLPAFQNLLSTIGRDERLTDVLLVDAAGKHIADPRAQQTWILNFFVGPILRAYFEEVQKIGFAKDVVDSLFPRISADIEAKSFPAIRLSPVLNLDVTFESIEIAPGLKLRRLSESEQEQWFNQHALFAPFSVLQIPDPSRLQCAVEVNWERQRQEPIDSSDAARITDNLITALRLLTARAVHVAFSEEKSISLLGVGGTAFTSKATPISFQEPAVIGEVEAGELVDLYGRLQSSINAERIALALRRWDSAFERMNEEDRLIDYWVALESLLTPDSAQELRFRASLRGASLLGQTADERKAIFNDLRRSYDWRSAIVHGDKKKAEKLQKRVPVQKIASATQSHLQRAILSIIQSDEVFDPTHVELRLLSKP